MTRIADKMFSPKRRCPLFRGFTVFYRVKKNQNIKTHFRIFKVKNSVSKTAPTNIVLVSSLLLWIGTCLLESLIGTSIKLLLNVVLKSNYSEILRKTAQLHLLRIKNSAIKNSIFRKSCRLQISNFTKSALRCLSFLGGIWNISKVFYRPQ